MNAGRVLVARATSRAAWSRRLIAIVRGVDRAIAWKVEQEWRAEARYVRARRQRRQRRRQRVASVRALVATVRRGWRR